MTSTLFLSRSALLSWDKVRGSKCSQQGRCQSQNSKVADLCYCLVASSAPSITSPVSDQAR